MKTLIWRLFFIILAALCFASCMPIGALVGTEADTMWVAPKRDSYELSIDTFFYPRKDLKIFASHRGFVAEVPWDRCEINIWPPTSFGEDPEPLAAIVNGINVDEDADDPEGIDLFGFGAGHWEVEVKFMGRNTTYWILITDANDIGPVVDKTPGGGGGIIIEWAKPDNSGGGTTTTTDSALGSGAGGPP